MGLFSRSLWLVADDPDGAWWCKCRRGIVDAPWRDMGMDSSPSDGAGWLWSCAKCDRAFMFARCARIWGTLEQLARRKTPRKQQIISVSGELVENTLLATPQDWLDSIQGIRASIREGERYVYFDGVALPARHGPVKLDGLLRSHDLPDLPHLSEPLMEQTIANPDYWKKG